MKIKTNDLSKLQKITSDFAKTRNLKKRADYPNMSITRYCWDVYHGMTDAAQADGRIEDYLFLRSLYDYLNDDHITTAIKHVLTDYV